MWFIVNGYVAVEITPESIFKEHRVCCVDGPFYTALIIRLREHNNSEHDYLLDKPTEQLPN